jgi:hypothetical protein
MPRPCPNRSTARTTAGGPLISRADGIWMLVVQVSDECVDSGPPLPEFARWGGAGL